VLIGTSTVAGAFSRPLVERIARHCARPVILPLSNPTSLAEATPADLLAWTDGRALVATGSPFPPVERPEGVRVIGQCNNCFLYPGLGFAAVALGLRAISDGMIDAGLHALAEAIPASRDPSAPLMPPLHEAASVSAAVAEAVARAGVREGQAPPGVEEEQVPGLLRRARWNPVYRPLIPQT
jgi:malate dehydrogenase (oxaloacetate-decarboxylating)